MTSKKISILLFQKVNNNYTDRVSVYYHANYLIRTFQDYIPSVKTFKGALI